MKKRIAYIFGTLILLGLIKKKMSKYSLIWGTILKGESRTFDDYNYYKRVNGSSKLYGKLNAKNTLPFSQKKLTEMTIGEVIKYQSQSRDSQEGQLWATGRFQIIPSTLSYMVKKLGIDEDTMYDEKTQYAIGDALVDERRTLHQYLNSKIPDTEKNLQLATLDVARTWSSVGVPFDTQGSRKFVNKDQSYYEGGGDRAHVDSNSVMNVLRLQRKALEKNLYL